MQTSSHVSLSLVEFGKLLGRDAPWGSHAEEEEEEEQMKKTKISSYDSIHSSHHKIFTLL